jgi:hypothetical protein
VCSSSAAPQGFTLGAAVVQLRSADSWQRYPLETDSRQGYASTLSLPETPVPIETEDFWPQARQGYGLFRRSYPQSASQRRVVVSFAPKDRSRSAVIPAKGGIHFLDAVFPRTCTMDSRFRGNDCVQGLQMTPVRNAAQFRSHPMYTLCLSIEHGLPAFV